MTEHSYNGWPASRDPGAIGIDHAFTAAGVTFPGGVRAGDVETVFRYLVEQLHKRVERAVQGWCWGYNYRPNTNNPSELSCHASGTALDYNAPRHPNKTPGTWSPRQIAEVHRILAELRNVVRWLEDSNHDSMHFEIHGDEHAVHAVALALTAPKRSAVRRAVRRVIPKRYPTLRLGSTGPAVRRLQQLLGLKVDGDYGPRTEATVRAYQARHKLVVDGVAGPATLRLFGW